MALLSSFAFGMSGPLASSLHTAGWSAGATLGVRIGGGALLLAIPGIIAIRRRWHLLWEQRGVVLTYGLFGVALAQLGFFQAIRYLDVGVALTIEYTGPVLVVGYAWLRHGEVPTVKIFLGALLALGGVGLVLDLVDARTNVNLVGLAWALLAAISLAGYFIAAGHQAGGLPPVAMTWAGFTVGAAALGVAAATGVLRLTVTNQPVALADRAWPPWAATVMLILITAVVAYLTGIAAARRLGPTLASFVSLAEVLFAVVLSWLLLGQELRTTQILGGALVIVGVVIVRLGHR